MPRLIHTTCSVCGAPFMAKVRSRSAGGTTRTCSETCRVTQIWRTQGVHESLTKVCIQCGVTFTAPYKNRRAEHCSNACRVKSLPKGGPIRGREVGCLECGKSIWVEPSLAHRKKFCSRSCLARYRTRTHAIKSPTTIETKLYEALNVLSITYVPQYGMGRYVVDAWLPEQKTIIEADGVYWHSLPDRQARDVKLAAYAERMNFRLLRLDEVLIKSLGVDGLAQHIRSGLIA